MLCLCFFLNIFTYVHRRIDIKLVNCFQIMLTLRLNFVMNSQLSSIQLERCCVASLQKIRWVEEYIAGVRKMMRQVAFIKYIYVGIY